MRKILRRVAVLLGDAANKRKPIFKSGAKIEIPASCII
jgi:hypothetical protein